MICEERFYNQYKQAPEAVSFCPYRVCPIGAHVDHNLGRITGLALDKGIHLAYKPKRNGVIELESVQFEKRAQWHVRAVPSARQGDWADYLRGVTIQLSREYPLSTGLCGFIEGTIPIGGLSSSAAVTISFLKALCDVNGIRLEPMEIVRMAKAAENEYVGVSCGKLDQCCEVLSLKDHLLYFDPSDDSYELIPTAGNMDPYDILIFFSGVERNLFGTKFNMRVDECRAAAYAILAMTGKEYGRIAQTNLRDVSVEDYLACRTRLPEPWRLRADHWFSETERVEKGVAAWRSGDIRQFGSLVFESGRSSIDNYQTGSPEMKTLYEIMAHTDGIYGGRFSGAGFKGCCMALSDPRYSESILEKVKCEYQKAYPGLKDRYSAYICHSADGVKF